MLCPSSGPFPPLILDQLVQSFNILFLRYTHFLDHLHQLRSSERFFQSRSPSQAISSITQNGDWSQQVRPSTFTLVYADLARAGALPLPSTADWSLQVLRGREESFEAMEHLGLLPGGGTETETEAVFARLLAEFRELWKPDLDAIGLEYLLAQYNRYRKLKP